MNNFKTVIKCGKGIELDVNFAEFSVDVVRYLLTLGARNALRDVHAGVEDPAECRIRSERKLADMRAGVTHRVSQNGNTAALAAKDEQIQANLARIAELEAQLAKQASRRGR